MDSLFIEYLEAYKSLDELCKQILRSDKGISKYIEEMENDRWGRMYVEGWKQDYKQLKHMRWLRNKLVHEVDSSNYCDIYNNDIMWLENFKSRILSCSDPFSLLNQAKNKQQEKPANNARKIDKDIKVRKYTRIESKVLRALFCIISILTMFIVANYFSISEIYGLTGYELFLLITAYAVFSMFVSKSEFKIDNKRLRNINRGCILLRIFLGSTVLSIIYYILTWAKILPHALGNNRILFWTASIIFCVLVEAVIFWIGIISIYISSVQLGIRWRVTGILCGWMIIINVGVLLNLIKIVENEVKVEVEKELLNKKRADEKICQTKYPILLVHGVFFRDSKHLNYWGRIPKELEKNGATIFYGNHQSASSVEESAIELTERIKEIVVETGCEKVNIIAHSKGGLDCRYAIAMTGAAPYVASLTTINTPHRGCEFADFLLSKIPKKQQELVAKTYNTTLKKIGDTNPDFLEAVYDLTSDSCKKRNEIINDAEGVYYQSVGSKLNKATSGRFPLNYTYKLVKFFDGPNDGLVGEKSFPWGEKYTFLTVKGNRGISHGDMVDLNRENFDEFDVREFYVQMVNELKNKNL